MSKSGDGGMPNRVDPARVSAGRTGRLTCIEANGQLARYMEWNVAEAGLAGQVTVIEGDARRVIPRLRSRFDFVLIDATKEQYLDYLRRLEPKLARGAVVVADNTKISFWSPGLAVAARVAVAAVRIPCILTRRGAAMLAKKTVKNQITLPKAQAAAGRAVL